MMAITPQQAAALSPSEREQVEHKEAAIDGRLRDVGTGTAIGVRGLSGRVVKELMRRYQKAGWNVQLISDERDGDYLQFRPAGAPCGAGRE